MLRWRSRFELERMRVAGSCSGDGELGLRPVSSQGVYIHGGRRSLRQWLVCLAQKEKALGKGGKLIYMDTKWGGGSYGSLNGCTLLESREIIVAAVAVCKYLGLHICRGPHPHPEKFSCSPAQQTCAFPPYSH